MHDWMAHVSIWIKFPMTKNLRILPWNVCLNIVYQKHALWSFLIFGSNAVSPYSTNFLDAYSMIITEEALEQMFLACQVVLHTNQYVYGCNCIFEMSELINFNVWSWAYHENNIFKLFRSNLHWEKMGRYVNTVCVSVYIIVYAVDSWANQFLCVTCM